MIFSAVAFGFDAASSWFCVAVNMYRAAECAQQRAETCVMNLLLVPVCDIATLCSSPAPEGWGRWQMWERVLAVPLLLGQWVFPESCKLPAAALQDVTAGAASPSTPPRWRNFSLSAGCSAFRFAFILVGHKLKVGSAEQLLFVAV